MYTVRVVSILLAFFGLACPAIAQDFVPGEVIVKLRVPEGSSKAMTFMGKAHAQKAMSLKASFGKINIYHFGLKQGQKVEDAIADLSQDPDVEYVEPNYILRKTQDTGIIRSYNEQEISQMAEAQGTQTTWATGGVDIGLDSFHQSKVVTAQITQKPIVAVIDTGLDLNHPVFTQTNSIWSNYDEVAGNGIDDDGNGYVDDVNGWNFVDNSSTMYDDDGHGTHVSGIILSVDQNILVTPRQDSRISIMPLKFLNGDGVGSTSNAIKAIYYAVQNGAVVLNNSWGGPSYSGALHEAVAYSYNNGVSFIAAAGNAAGNNDSLPMYPANYDVPNVLAVAATTDSDNLASFSNYGNRTVHLGSPGVMIYSTIPGGWGSASGTSMAAPFVSGVAIQMKVESAQMLGYQLKSIIFSQADPKSGLTNKVYTGSRLDASGSINYAKTASVDSSQPAYYGSFSQNRELASSIAGGGCGTVAKLIADSTNRFGGGGGSAPRGPETWYVLMVIALLAAPVVLTQWLRHRHNPQNRRRYERFRISSEVTVKVGDQELIGSVSSISLGGVQINTEALLENGGIVRMQISSPDGKEMVNVEGKVVWSEAKKAYGVAFANAPHSALYRIGQWTKALQKAG